MFILTKENMDWIVNQENDNILATQLVNDAIKFYREKLEKEKKDAEDAQNRHYSAGEKYEQTS